MSRTNLGSLQRRSRSGAVIEGGRPRGGAAAAPAAPAARNASTSVLGRRSQGGVATGVSPMPVSQGRKTGRSGETKDLEVPEFLAFRSSAAPFLPVKIP